MDESPDKSQTVALNARVGDDERALLQALLQATDYGVLMSGLDRQDILANRRLGELFNLTPQELVDINPEAARKIARDRLRDPNGFDELLDTIYADPEISFQDELELRTDPARSIRRYTGPVRDGAGKPIGRLWTFLDITETKRLQAEVETQLTARTNDFHATAVALNAMNELCRTASQFKNTGQLLAAIVQVLQTVFAQQSVAVLLLSRDRQAVVGKGSARDGNVLDIKCAVHDVGHLVDVQFNTEQSHMFAPAGDEALWLVEKLGCDELMYAQLRLNETCFGLLVLGCVDGSGDGLDRYREDHVRALVEQVSLALETHRLQADLQAALDGLQSAQRGIVQIEKLRTAGVLATSIAHDIRNILSTMEIEIEMDPAGTAPGFREHLNRFSAMTHRLLAFSRPGVLDTRPTSITDVVSRVVALIRGQADISGVAITTHYAEGDDTVSADETQLEHLFVNLCLNAIQAMNSRGGRLAVSVRNEAHWITVSVIDTGEGIPAELLDRVFEPFFTTKANGFGLGLFSCKRIVEEHGGQIAASSEPGSRTEFTVMLPVIPRNE